MRRFHCFHTSRISLQAAIDETTGIRPDRRFASERSMVAVVFWRSSGITTSLLSDMASSSGSSTSFVDELNQLGTDLQNGDLTSAQDDMLSLDSLALNAASTAAANCKWKLHDIQFCNNGQSGREYRADSGH